MPGWPLELDGADGAMSWRPSFVMPRRVLPGVRSLTRGRKSGLRVGAAVVRRAVFLRTDRAGNESRVGSLVRDHAVANVLVIDDDRDSSEMVVRYLAKGGHA